MKTKLVILFGLLLAFPLSLAVSKSGSAKAIQALSAGTTTRVSVSSTGGQSNGSSEYSVISADGRYIAYYSFAGNLVQDDTNSASDVFVYDRLAKTTERVSIGSNGQQGNQDSGRFGVDISADGRYVAFGANASNLVDDDTNGVPDTFIHDRLTHQTSRVSVSSNGIQGNATSYSLAISANGRYVAFSSSASNLVAGDTNGYPDIFLYDQQTDNTERVNLNSSGEQAKDWGSSGVAISATGRYVVFGSGASNLVPGDTYGTSDVFVRDRQTGTTRIISINGDGQIGNDSSSSPKITGDGRYIAFLSEADNLVPDDVNDRRDAFIHDIQTGITEIVSVSSTGEQANRNIYGPTTLTEDGRYVTFMSQATNLVPDDTKSLYDVFVYDRMTKTIERVSVNSVGQQGNHATGFFGLDISADGRFVVFDSAATNFTDGDTNNVYDIFLRDRGVRPFLDLPVSYSNFAQTAQGNVSGNGGRVNSWFDHNLPNYSTNNDLYRWNGPYAGAASVNRDHCIIDQQSCYDGHNGIDFQHQIHMPNEPIYAAASGTVTTTNITGYGNQVVIDHHNGYATLYGHLKTIGVTVGTTVTVGQPIGIMGNTGISIGGDGTHLHFGVYYDQNADGWTSNEVVDPYGWIGPGNDPCRATNPASCGPQQYLWKYPLQAKQMADSDGGIITSLSGNTSIAVQAGTLTSTINLELWDTPPVAAPSAQLRSVGHSFLFQVFEWLSASSVNRAQSTTATSFAQPVTVTVSYSDTATLHLDESRLGIYRWDEINNLWMALTTTVNLTENQAVAQTVEIGNFDLQAPLLCLADSLEPNDNYYAASAISAYPVAVSSLFDGVQDEDWFRFNAAAGRQYVVQTDNLAGGVDTAIAIYDLDGLTELASDDNSSDDMASRLEWQAPLDGTYFVRVFQSSTSLSGCTATYRLGIVQLQQISLPLILR